MSIGEWDDNREIWYFQALIESTKLDSMCENDHRLLTQGEQIWTFPVTTRIRDATSGTGYEVLQYDNTDGTYDLISSVGGITQWFAEFAFHIHDRCPYDRLWIRLWVEAMGSTDQILVHRRDDATRSLNSLGTFLDGAAFSASGWVGMLIDITSWAVGSHQVAIEFWDVTTSDTLSIGAGFAKLVNTVTGVTA